jgi:hypothetical protein
MELRQPMFQRHFQDYYGHPVAAAPASQAPIFNQFSIKNPRIFDFNIASRDISLHSRSK